MFEIKARVYDLQVTTDEMHRIRWGLYRDAIFQAEYQIKWNGIKDYEEFKANNKSIDMHKWICRVLEHGYMGDHDKLVKKIKEILNEKDNI